MLYGALSVGVSFQAVATGMTNAEFLELDNSYKKFWIQGAMYSLGHVAAAKSKETGKCVIDWYFGDKRAERNSLILASMEKYPSSYPSAIFIALTERECGTYHK
ncbi:hypothetical protein BET10_07235 [Pseudoalteromonas amylolytica]|uniref:Rap1a immunity protein domain-containing protein n=1 Tax=Pseudoalteromonas amylolytica TaxID=1859457 RepID=A0A1S1N0K1_9GAMM|nr:hypothetical protein BET10_07235 [Pseudoalteromonas amylolytica]